MRFVLVSTHTDQTTGYAKVAHNMLKQLGTLTPKVKVFHFGFQRHPNKTSLRKVADGVVQYDAVANEDPKEEGFGFNKIHEYLEMVGPDVVMIYNDPLIIYKFIEAMKHERGKTPYKLWIYIDQVYDGIAQPLIQTINEHADRIYCFTDIWKEKYLNYAPFPDVRVLEHAVDPTMFTNMPNDNRKGVRANMNIPENAVVMLNANRNSQRKRLDLTISGFVRLIAKKPSAPYYMVFATNMTPQSGGYYDIQRIFIEELRIQNLTLQDYASRLLLIDTSPPNIVGDDGINSLYNIADIGINTSDGEGFGLCQLEHLYTGAPQIVTDVGSYRSFLDEKTSTFIPPTDRTYFSGSMPLGFHMPTFSGESVAHAMENMIDNLSEYKKNVSAYKFKSWATVCDNWLEDVLTV